MQVFVSIAHSDTLSRKYPPICIEIPRQISIQRSNLFQLKYLAKNNLTCDLGGHFDKKKKIN